MDAFDQIYKSGSDLHPIISQVPTAVNQISKSCVLCRYSINYTKELHKELQILQFSLTKY